MTRRPWHFLVAALLVAGMTACEGPEGPAGPQGPAGPAGSTGPQGPAGPAGQDANENCTQCHVADTKLFNKQVQYSASVHRNGGHFRLGTNDFCSGCHSHEGFVEKIATGSIETTGVDFPSPINCRTCHMIHTTYTDADFAFRNTDPPLLYDDHIPVTDFGEDGNLCASCHFSRGLTRGGPLPVIGGAPVTPTSSRFGYHHGPQGLVLKGVGAFEFAGDEAIPDGPNTHGDNTDNPESCVTCHMASGRGDEAGGHTWNMSWGVEGDRSNNTTGCETCHTGGLDSFDDHPFGGPAPQSEIKALLIELETELVRIGIKREMSPGYTLETLSTQIYANVAYPADVAAAFVNWQMFAEDRSLGIHNPPYARAVLKNTIAVAKTYPDG